MRIKRIGVVAAAVALSVASTGCGGDDSEEGDATTTEAPATTEAADTTGPPTSPPESIEYEAPLVSGFTVDGDAGEWADVPAQAATLEPIGGADLEPRDAVVKVAHDGENVHVLLQVEDDYNWNEGEDAHLTSAAGVQWAIDEAAGGAMGATDDDQETSLGMVDIWHWELECGPGEVSGGSTSEAGDGEDAGNDFGCNFDDEWSTDPETREDDNGEGAENSLAGSWSHSDPTADADGTWTFEMSRPLDTGDSTDAAFTAGGTGRLAVAYWDADATPEGWEDDGHVQSANLGWIIVTFAS